MTKEEFLILAEKYCHTQNLISLIQKHKFTSEELQHLATFIPKNKKMKDEVLEKYGRHAHL